MNRYLFLLLFAFSTSIGCRAQFHTLKVPQSSNYVFESQRLGVTDIALEYHSPKVNGRDVWNNPGVIPQNGEPIAWRAGANMNTTIDFSTDVMINGKALPKGKYGFHVIPKANSYTILFAHNNNQWGSYYLDLDNDITLSVDVQDTLCAFSEKLDYEFIPKSESALILALEWGEKRLPFEVSVDLNKTVVESFESELLGINTYRWEAWNDAAKWCLNHEVNLEQALAWVDRSMNGGFNGFAANKNMENITTKARILKKLDRSDELDATIADAMKFDFSPMQANYFTIFLLRSDRSNEAVTFADLAAKKYEGTWFLELNQGISRYMDGNSRAAVKQLQKVKPKSPESFHSRIDEIIEEMKAGTYKLR